MISIRYVYLALAVIGAVLPMSYFVVWFQEFGWSLSGIIRAWNVNDATTGMVYDLTVSAIALTIWVVAETVQNRNWSGLLAIPATFMIGVSCGFPLYLYLRRRPS